MDRALVKKSTASGGFMYTAAKIVRANNEYKYDSYIDAINYLVQADEIHREDVSSLVIYFPTTTKEDVSV